MRLIIKFIYDILQNINDKSNKCKKKKGTLIMNKDIKMLVSDYDQTFYTSDEDIEKNKLAVKKFMEEGNIFVIATGRSYQDFRRKEEQYNIKYNYVILNHGATVLDNKGNIIYNFSIENSIIDEIKKLRVYLYGYTFGYQSHFAFDIYHTKY